MLAWKEKIHPRGMRVEKYIGSIDQGTTSTRFEIFDQAGNVVAFDQKEHKQIFSRPGWVEHDPMEIWACTREVFNGALAKGGFNTSDLAAIGITNQRETAIVWEKSTGRPVYNAIVWQDTRDHHICRDRLGEIPVYSLVGGKWTTYRAFSEQVTNIILDDLRSSRMADTASISIGVDSPGLKTNNDYSLAEIVKMTEREKVIHLADLVLRRTLLAYLGLLSRPRLEELAHFLGESLGWEIDKEKSEIEQTIQILADKHGLRI
jgi:hypothetical protein